MFRSLHMKLTLILLLLITSLMAVVGAFLTTSVTSFYIDSFYQQMSSAFGADRREFVADLRSAAAQPDGAERIQEIMEVNAGMLGIDYRTRNYFILDGQSGTYLDGSAEAAELPREQTANLRTARNAVAQGDSTLVGDRSDITADYMDAAIPIMGGGNAYIIYILDNKDTVSEGFLTVGEAPGITPARNEHITDPENGELDMLFLFEHLDADCEDNTKWKPTKLELPKLKEILNGQQNAVSKAGWASLFFDNHDQPRIVSRWGDDSAEESRVRSAKALGLMLHMHRGTPYIYEGEELGMTNAHFTKLDQYRDLESLNAYRQRVIETGVQDSESMMHGIAERSRDNARTPMQWDDSKYAGFTAPDAATEPWINVNPNHVEINAAAQCDDPKSVHAFYKQLIDLRHRNPVVAAGDFQLLDASDRQVYSFVRALSSKDGQAAKRLLVMVNVSGEIARIPSETAALLPLDVDESHIVITTHDSAHTKLSLTKRELAPWEGVAIEL